MNDIPMEIRIDDNGKQLKMDISINSDNPKQLADKLKALKALSTTMNHEDYMVTVELLKEKPELVPAIKDMLREGEEMSEGQLMLRIPKYVRKIVKILKA